MSALGTVLVWVCAAVVALPLSPCALLPASCCQHQMQAKAESTPEPERACCAHDDQPAPQPSEHEQQNPCTSDCCSAGPLAPAGHKLSVEAPVSLFDLPPQFDDVSVGGIAPLTIAAVQSLPLNVLHCQWRC